MRRNQDTSPTWYLKLVAMTELGEDTRSPHAVKFSFCYLPGTTTTQIWNFSVIGMSYKRSKRRHEFRESLGDSVGWVSDSWFWLRSWSHGWWDRALHRAPCWQYRTCLGFSLFLCLCSSPTHTFSLSPQISNELKNIYMTSFLYLNMDQPVFTEVCKSASPFLSWSQFSNCRAMSPKGESWEGGIVISKRDTLGKNYKRQLHICLL